MQIILWLAVIALIAVLAVPVLRRPVISKPVLSWFKSVLPPMSATEQAAIDAGTTWWDADVFSGSPDWEKLLHFPAAQLSEEEQAFVDGPVNELCAMLDDWSINHELDDLPENVWQYLKDNQFFGMIIPKKYGGLGFSPRGQSEVVMKIATRSPATAITVMVPNSIGPAELLLHYGTDAQKDFYLPRLANGRELPAFALTNPHAGSDAGSMPDTGVVCRGQYQGKETLGFRVNWQKRYITLGPVCTVLGLAFKAVDPDGLLGDAGNPGITCALVPSDTDGVTIGSRHDTGSAFQNGPNSGKDVFVPMDWVIGGQQQVGNGWKMLMNCLSVGRAISLPALGAAAGKLCSRTTGAYARVRKQFKTAIGSFEGIGEVLARIAGLTYRMDSARLLTAGALNDGEKPAVISAILKYHNTEGMRKVINDAMDVHAGRAVCDGPTNYLRSTYRMVPVAITVEGANILTRSMIIFGQGAIRCHPYVLDEMQAAADSDGGRGLVAFDRLLFKHIRFTTGNAIRALAHGLTGARFAKAPRNQNRRFYQQLTRMSAAFAFLTDVALLTLGGELKRREGLSARFGDILSHLYMASAVLKRFEDEGANEADRPLVEWALQDSLATIQDRMLGILDNFPSRILATALRVLVLPLGRPYRAPTDKVSQAVASIVLAQSEGRDRLTRGMFIPAAPGEPVSDLERLVVRVDEIEPLVKIAAKHCGSEARLWTDPGAIDAAVEDGVLEQLDAVKLREYGLLLMNALSVDEFPVDRVKQSAAIEGAA